MDAEIYDAFSEQRQRYVRGRLIPAEDQLEELGRVPDDILAEMRDMGLFWVTMPEEYGGAGMNVSQYVGFIRELAYASPAYRSIVSINIGMVCKSLIGFGTEQQTAHWLHTLAGGPIAAFGLTDPDRGSDSTELKTTTRGYGPGTFRTGHKNGR